MTEQQSEQQSEVQAEVRGHVGFLTLNRPRALNALSLGMIRQLAAALLAWRDDPAVHAVAIRGMGKDAANTTGSRPFGTFCAGGDIRFFHQAALAGNPELEDFFTEEYRLNHLVHTFPKPYLPFLDGIVIGGGMGIAGHGRSPNRRRIVTERTRMSMPETLIGLFPDVGGGYFLSRCPGRIGESLALTGRAINGSEALATGLADHLVNSSSLPDLWEALADTGLRGFEALLRELTVPDGAASFPQQAAIDRIFALPTVPAIIAALEADCSSWADDTSAALRKRSPLMLHVALEQLRRGRTMELAGILRMERDLMRRCFHRQGGCASETVEGIRALVIDKDHRPRWSPARIEDVRPQDVAAFFESPWPAFSHPLRSLDP